MLAAAVTAQMPDARSSWLPVLLLLAIGIAFALTNVIASILVGPSRQGEGKSTTYESGMIPIGDTRRRFNVRFYIVAMVFLVFDVTIVFFYPFAGIFAGYVKFVPEHAERVLLAMAVFLTISLFAYVYAWGKGVFRFD